MRKYELHVLEGKEGTFLEQLHRSLEGCDGANKRKAAAPLVKKGRREDDKGYTKRVEFRRVLTVNHECWDDPEDYKAALAADPRIFEWGLGPCKDEEEDKEEGVAGKGDQGGESGQSMDAGNIYSAPNSWVGPAVPLRSVGSDAEGGALPLILPAKASWFDVDSVHELERQAAPEYFDGWHVHQGKTEASYLWHRREILALWHLHVAAHVSRLFHSQGGTTGKKRPATESAAPGNSKRRAPRGGAGAAATEQDGGNQGGEGEEAGEGEGGRERGEAVTFSWPAAMPVSVCLKSIPAHSSDILRIFEVLQAHPSPNPYAPTPTPKTL